MLLVLYSSQPQIPKTRFSHNPYLPSPLTSPVMLGSVPPQPSDLKNDEPTISPITSANSSSEIPPFALSPLSASSQSLKIETQEKIPSSPSQSPLRSKRLKFQNIPLQVIIKINEQIINRQYDEASELIASALIKYSEKYILQTREMACAFMLKDQQKIITTSEKVLANARNTSSSWVRGWTHFFLGCLPLLENQALNFKEMEEAFEVTDDPVVGVFTLKMLSQHNPDLKNTLEKKYRVTLETLESEIEETHILPLSFLEDMQTFKVSQPRRHIPSPFNLIPDQTINKIDLYISTKRYQEAYELINSNLNQYPNQYVLKIRKMACELMLKDQQSLRDTANNVLEAATQNNDHWVRGWCHFFLGCVSLLDDNRLTLEEIQIASEVTEDKVVNIFVLELLNQYNPTLKQSLEAEREITLESLYDQVNKTPTLPFSLLKNIKEAYPSIRKHHRRPQ